jgi:broad specificity phosphatase PhoE
MMGRLLLVRHGQASFLEHDYDKLSFHGEAQSRLLGDYWARRNVAFDRVFSGPRVRQQDTARIVGERYRNSGIAFPEPVVMREFDEYAADAVLDRSLPRLLESDENIGNLHRAFLASDGGEERRRSFQKMFEIVIGRWVAGKLAVPGVESWSEFCARVNRGIAQIVSGARPGELAAVFSSGGPIAVAMQRALNLSPRDTLGTLWMSRNCSYSEFLFSRDRFTLSAFNAFPHLDDPELLTYR